ncbi:MAG: hypothetical protein ACTHLB_03590 [Parafilimonas sp.]
MNQNTTAENSTATDLLEEDNPLIEGYNKPVKKTRNILFVLAALQLLLGILMAMQQTVLPALFLWQFILA